MKRIALVAAFGLTAFVVVYAVAATMGLTSDELGAGAASVTACGDPDDFTIDSVLLNEAGEVTQVTVGGLPLSCVGGQLTINLTRNDGTSIGVGGPVTVTSPATTVNIGGSPPSLSDVDREVIIIVGP